jgi:NAD+ synthase (glutamine-hydrolysing)
MRIALAQINPCLGDFAQNSLKILEASKQAVERHADIVVFPEATLFGYHPMDLLERHSVIEEQMRELKALIKKLPKNICIIFGAFTPNKSNHGKPFFNSALVVVNNKITFTCAKELLPTYDVFDDARHIQPGDVKDNVFKYKGKKILITICEDIWAWPLPGDKGRSNYDHNPIKKIKPKSVDYIVNLSASPFHVTKFKMREHVVRETAKYLKAPMVYVNMVGAQDELIFDGGSFAVDNKGKTLGRAMFFEEDLVIVDYTKQQGQIQPMQKTREEILRQALVLGIRDFCAKSGLKQVVLGLSGGIDSALVACLAVDAIGSQNVMAIAMPGPFNAKESESAAEKLAKNLHIPFKVLEIEGAYKSVVEGFEKSFGAEKFGLVNENIQARLRGVYLMAAANRYGRMVLNTSNKSEMATGYGTLYGDMVGGLSPIGDLLKEDVYKLSRHYNRDYELIPTFIIDRAPSAELRPDQKDADSLPEYAKLDPAVVDMVEASKPAKTETQKFVLSALLKSEFKRWQAAPILKVRTVSFGRGRRFPVAHRAKV